MRLLPALSATLCFIMPCGVSGTEKDILVGVSYFAGWWKELSNKWHGQGWKIGQPDWRPEFPERVPALGEYNEQATMDREIISAHRTPKHSTDQDSAEFQRSRAIG